MMLHELTLRGLLSFGPDTPPLRLERLNVLIGPNGSGKSNVIEAIGLLRASAAKLTTPLRGASGGVAEWIWKGSPDGTAVVDAVVDNPAGSQAIRHRIAFAAAGPRFELTDEVIENEQPHPGHADAFFYYRYQGGHPVILVQDAQEKQLQRQDVLTDESILSQRKDPDQYPVLAHLAGLYGNVRLYREWQFGRTAILRAPQPADAPHDRLEEDFSNLGIYLSNLGGMPKAKRALLEHLRELYPGLDGLDVRVKGNTVEVFFTEGDYTIPAGRLSDGTLRYLCLLAILCDPEPPELVCIEEPELGLHPDMLPKIADLLIAASERTQLIITTHSDILVDAMTDQPESVVVVEKDAGQTTLNRLNRADLERWLGKYRLGELWIRGDIGGTRW
jgi:predicted ATPase